ncbi:MAG: thymidine phosphorylase, partial [Candidatus Poseidoniales archaeon]
MSKAIHDLVRGVVNGSLSDDEVIHWLRAVFEGGLSEEDTIALTEAMRDSGEVLEWGSEIANLVVDKHSTGGVGDKTSLPLAPALAACGLKVPMISGRGLGHTG